MTPLETFTQNPAPLGSLTLWALVALIPLLVVFVALGVLKAKAHWAALAGLACAIIVAIAAFHMPATLALLSAAEGAAYGLFPIQWIVITAILLYQLTVVSGRLEHLRSPSTPSATTRASRRSSSPSASVVCSRPSPASAPRWPSRRR